MEINLNFTTIIILLIWRLILQKYQTKNIFSDPPENITVSQKIVPVVEGHTPEKVICSSKAYPEASYQWRKEGGTEIIMKGKALILNTPMGRREGGNYVCEAHNRHGTVEGTAYINVLCE